MINNTFKTSGADARRNSPHLRRRESPFAFKMASQALRTSPRLIVSVALSVRYSVTNRTSSRPLAACWRDRNSSLYLR